MTAHGEVVQHLEPTATTPTGPAWQVDGITVAAPTAPDAPVMLVVEVGTVPVEVAVLDPETLARALLSARGMPR